MKIIPLLKHIFLKKNLKEIKLVVMDFDGIFTDGGIYLGKNSSSLRRFDVKDGIGIKLLQNESVQIAILSGSNSEIIDRRAKNLGIDNVIKATSNKLTAIKKLQKKLNISKKETLFLGDDINDLPVLDSVKLFIVPANASNPCKKIASFIGESDGGRGFIREIAEKILYSKGKNPNKPFFSKNDNSD